MVSGARSPAPSFVAFRNFDLAGRTPSRLRFGRNHALTQPDPRPLAVPVDEDHASAFEGALQHRHGGISRPPAALEKADGDDAKMGRFGEPHLGPIKQGSRRPALCRSDHRPTLSKWADSITSLLQLRSAT